MANYTFKCTNRKEETFTSDIFKSYYDNIMIENSNFIGCEFIECDFSKTKILKSNIDGCTFKNCIWSSGNNKLNCVLSNIVDCKVEYNNESTKFDKTKIIIDKCNIINTPKENTPEENTPKENTPNITI